MVSETHTILLWKPNLVNFIPYSHSNQYPTDLLSFKPSSAVFFFSSIPLNQNMTKIGAALQTSSSEITSKSDSTPMIATHGNSEFGSILIANYKLNGQNYLQWSQSVLMFISGKGKDEYLTGEIEILEKGDPKYRLWKSDNIMIMSWLINSMNNDIGENFLLYGQAKEIWDAAKETYSSSENTAELFQIEIILHDFRQ